MPEEEEEDEEEEEIEEEVEDSVEDDGEPVGWFQRLIDQRAEKRPICAYCGRRKEGVVCKGCGATKIVKDIRHGR